MSSLDSPKGRQSRARLHPVSTSPEVGLVVAAATAPGTFAPSLSPRSSLDQGLVTGLATGLHYLLTTAAEDLLDATARFVAGGPSPAGARPAAPIPLPGAAGAPGGAAPPGPPPPPPPPPPGGAAPGPRRARRRA